jgi:tripartite-type tricarboxylate transporter receptor subunit TctC
MNAFNGLPSMTICNHRRPPSPIPCAAAVATMILLACAPAARAQTAEPFYRGKTISLIAPADPGGSYDMNLRIISRHIGKWIPGRPHVIVQNMLGAGGLRAINYLYERAPQDGTVIGMPVQENVIADVIGTSDVRYKVTDFNWIGRLTSGVDAIVVWHGLGVRSVADAKKTEIVLGATGPASGTMLYPQVMNALLGTRFKVISGYKHTDTLLAVERGETHGAYSSLTTIRSIQPRWLPEQKVHAIVMIASDRVAGFDAVPTLAELADNPADKQVLTIFSSASTVGRAIATTPNVPAERVGLLRNAFTDMLKDPDFLADFAKSKTDLEPLTGAALQAFIVDTRNVSPEVLARARNAIRR